MRSFRITEAAIKRLLDLSPDSDEIKRILDNLEQLGMPYRVVETQVPGQWPTTVRYGDIKC